MRIKKWMLLLLVPFIVAISCTACGGGVKEINDKGVTEESPLQQEEPLGKSDVIELNHTYQTRFGKVNLVTCPEFQFDYPNNWEIISEELNNEAFGEKNVISNDRGTTITYMHFASIYGLGGGGRNMQKVEVSKVADSSFVPTIPAGTDSDYSGLGTIIVAKLKIVGELYMDEDSDFTAVDGAVYYAVLPESYVGEHQVVGLSGFYNEFFFKYPGLYAFIAEAPSGKFTTDEEKEVIAILASFRDE
jgi:hypothetical protein